MSEMRNAYYASLCLYLGLASKELAELGGFSDRFARDLLVGKRPFPQDVKDALDLLKDDVDVMVDAMVAQVQDGDGALFVFKNNDELRDLFPNWPARGAAKGGFVGPHRIAALEAKDALADEGIDVDLYFNPGVRFI